jgi:hypothetical protein
VDEPPDGPDWLHEIKFDGYRMHARLDRGSVRLLTRTGLDWTQKYPAIASAVSSIPAAQAYLDGALCGIRSVSIKCGPGEDVFPLPFSGGLWVWCGGCRVLRRRPRSGCGECWWVRPAPDGTCRSGRFRSVLPSAAGAPMGAVGSWSLLVGRHGLPILLTALVSGIDSDVALPALLVDVSVPRFGRIGLKIGTVFHIRCGARPFVRAAGGGTGGTSFLDMSWSPY